jgi:hypothetical protein
MTLVPACSFTVVSSAAMVCASFFRVPVLTIPSSVSAFAARKLSTVRSAWSTLPWRDCMVRLLFEVGRGGAECAERRALVRSRGRTVSGLPRH